MGGVIKAAGFMAEIDPGKLSGWYTALAPALILFARQMVGASAEDIVQDAFVQLMAQRSEPPNVKGWLYRTVRNAAISHTRSGRSRAERERSVCADRGRWFEQRIDDLIDAGAAHAAVNELPAQAREIVVLRIWSQLNFAEIAELVGRPLSSVYDEYKNAVVLLRTKMESSCQKKVQ